MSVCSNLGPFLLLPLRHQRPAGCAEIVHQYEIRLRHSSSRRDHQGRGGMSNLSYPKVRQEQERTGAPPAERSRKPDLHDFYAQLEAELAEIRSMIDVRNIKPPRLRGVAR